MKIYEIQLAIIKRVVGQRAKTIREGKDKKKKSSKTIKAEARIFVFIAKRVTFDTRAKQQRFMEALRLPLLRCAVQKDPRFCLGKVRVKDNRKANKNESIMKR